MKRKQSAVFIRLPSYRELLNQSFHYQFYLEREAVQSFFNWLTLTKNGKEANVRFRFRVRVESSNNYLIDAKLVRMVKLVLFLT